MRHTTDCTEAEKHVARATRALVATDCGADWPTARKALDAAYNDRNAAQDRCPCGIARYNRTPTR